MVWEASVPTKVTGYRALPIMIAKGWITSQRKRKRASPVNNNGGPNCFCLETSSSRQCSTITSAIEEVRPCNNVSMLSDVTHTSKMQVADDSNDRIAAEILPLNISYEYNQNAQVNPTNLLVPVTQPSPASTGACWAPATKEDSPQQPANKKPVNIKPEGTGSNASRVEGVIKTSTNDAFQGKIYSRPLMHYEFKGVSKQPLKPRLSQIYKRGNPNPKPSPIL